MTDTIAQIKALHTKPKSTKLHTTNCWKWHPECAIAALITVIETQREQLRELTNERDHWQNKGMQ